MKKRIVSIVAVLVVLVGGYLLFQDGKPSETSPQPSPNTTQRAVTPASPPAFDTSKYSLSDPRSIWVISNKQRALDPKDYAPDDLVNVGGQRLRQEAATALQKLLAGAQAANLTITPLSGYRSYQTQVTVYSREVATYGQAVADTQSARPGHSEHQTGLAIDVGGGGCGIEDCFGTTSEGKWLAENAHRYGFIIRYPEGRQNVTGYRYEPWHIRYIGMELATEMKKQGALTLEEFFGLPAAATY